MDCRYRVLKKGHSLVVAGPDRVLVWMRVDADVVNDAAHLSCPRLMETLRRIHLAGVVAKSSLVGLCCINSASTPPFSSPADQHRRQERGYSPPQGRGAGPIAREPAGPRLEVYNVGRKDGRHDGHGQQD